MQKTDREKHKEKEGIKVHDAERIKLKQKKKEEQRRMSGTLTSSSTTHTATSVCGSIEQRRFSSNTTPKQTPDQKPTRSKSNILVLLCKLNKPLLYHYWKSRIVEFRIQLKNLKFWKKGNNLLISMTAT
jgi:hypothetical protein